MSRWLLYLLVATQCALLVRLLRTGTYHAFGIFTFYITAAAALSLLPSHPDDPAWWSWWVYPQTCMLIVLAGTVIESLHRTLRLVRDGAGVAVIATLIGALCVWVPWGLHHLHVPLFPYLAWRTYTLIQLTVTLLTAHLYMWHRPAPVARYARRHGLLLLTLLVSHAAAALYGGTLGKGQGDAWYAAQFVYMCVSAVTYGVWSVAVPRKGEA